MNYWDYYDRFYPDEGYAARAAFVNCTLAKYGIHEGKILDLGCGSGRHKQWLKNYQVTGVDKEASFKPDICADIRKYRGRTKYDAVTALFHVMSYQVTNYDLFDVLRTVRKNKKPNGVFIFDFWYGPTTLLDPPITTVRMLDDVTRISESRLLPELNAVAVDITVLNGKTRLKETHEMRYFFFQELEFIFAGIGLSVLETQIEGRYAWAVAR